MNTNSAMEDEHRRHDGDGDDGRVENVVEVGVERIEVVVAAHADVAHGIETTDTSTQMWHDVCVCVCVCVFI